jgi:regulator of sigma E protease
VNEIFQTVVTIFLFFFILGALVLVHEFGHFVTARLAGVRVLEFGVGFPPRAKVLGVGGVSKAELESAVARRQAALDAARGDRELTDAILDAEPQAPVGTLYTLNWLPIGGFVKLEGEDGDEADDPRSFARARLPVRLVILAAGVFMNLLVALAIFTLIAWLATPVIGIRFPAVDPGSPAESVGLMPGDAIVSVNGQTYEYFNGDKLLDDLRSHAGETVVLGIDRPTAADGDVTVALRTPAEVAEGKGALGIRTTDAQPFFETHFTGQYTGRDLPAAVGIGVSETFRWFGLILAGLGDLARNFVANPTAPPGVAGPVGIATQIGQVFFGVGPIMTLFVAGILSANLALVNALPFPPLDGGRALIIVLKSIFGKRISLRAERLTYVVGFVFLFAFLIWVTGFDLLRILGGGT